MKNSEYSRMNYVEEIPRPDPKKFMMHNDICEFAMLEKKSQKNCLPIGKLGKR